MPDDISQPSEGESRRSDRAQRDASSRNGGRVRDFATLPFQRHEEQERGTEQQTNGKGLAPAERKNRRAIDENGKLVEKQIMLSNRYNEDHPGLAGGNEHEVSQYFKDTGKLAASDWELLKTKLLRVEPAFYPFIYAKGVNTQDVINRMNLNIINEIRYREINGSNILRNVKNKLNIMLKAYNDALDCYQQGWDGGDYPFVNSLSNNGPKEEQGKDEFINSIKNSLDSIEQYKAHAHNDLEE